MVPTPSPTSLSTAMVMLEHIGLQKFDNRRAETEYFIKNRPPRIMHALKNQSRQLPGVGAAILYGVCSTSMAFLNKAILTTYEFDYPFAILVFQMIFTILVLHVLKAVQVIDYPDVTLAHCRAFLVPSLCYAMNAALGLYALGRMNIPMYGVLKRCTPVVSLVLACFMLKKGPPSATVITSVLMMTVGCVVAGSGDLSFDTLAYACGAASNITQALYLTLVQCHSEKRSTIETLHLNSINTLPFLLVMSLLNREPFSIIFHPELFSAVFLLLLVLVTALGCLLNYSMFLCTAKNSALTTTVVGMLKTIVQTTLGFFTFGGVAVNAVLMTGVVANLSGGILYAFAKYSETADKAATAVLPRTVKDLHRNDDSKSDVNGHVKVDCDNNAATLSGAFYSETSQRERHPSVCQE